MNKKLSPILGLILIVVIVSVYFFIQKNQSQQDTEDMRDVATIQEAVSDCKYNEDFCSYMSAQAEAMKNGVIITSSSEIADYGMSTSKMKIDGNDNIEITNYQDGQLKSNMVVFEKITYMQDQTDGAWYALNTASTEEAADQATISEIKNTYDENQDMQVEKINSEACGDLTCDKYAITILQNDVASTIYTWIDTKAHLARKVEITFEGGTNVMEYQYEAVEISKPSPIKEMPGMNASMMATESANTQGQMPSQEELEKMMEEYSLDAE
jgi:hypothetical protein